MPIPKQRYWNMNVIQRRSRLRCADRIRHPGPARAERFFGSLGRVTGRLMFHFGVYNSAPTRTIVVESQIQVRKPIAAPSDPYVSL